MTCFRRGRHSYASSPGGLAGDRIPRSTYLPEAQGPAPVQASFTKRALFSIEPLAPRKMPAFALQ